LRVSQQEWNVALLSENTCLSKTNISIMDDAIQVVDVNDRERREKESGTKESEE
jgi:hypothetical protein